MRYNNYSAASFPVAGVIRTRPPLTLPLATINEKARCLEHRADSERWNPTMIEIKIKVDRTLLATLIAVLVYLIRQ